MLVWHVANAEDVLPRLALVAGVKGQSLLAHRGQLRGRQTLDYFRLLLRGWLKQQPAYTAEARAARAVALRLRRVYDPHMATLLLEQVQQLRREPADADA